MNRTLRLVGLAAAAAASTAMALSPLAGAWAAAAQKGHQAVKTSQGSSRTRVSAPIQNYRPAAVPNTPLQAAWNGIVQNADLAHATISAYAYDVTTHQVLAAIHPNERLTPASVMKLFASATAMADLGSSFRYVTKVEAKPASSTGAPGAIYLVGGGDPWLEADGALTLEQMAKEVAGKIRSASQVVGAGTLFGGSHTGTGWTWDDLPWNYTPNISGLTVERDQLNLLVKPGPLGGPPTYVVNPLNPSVDPPLAFFHIYDQAKTVAAGGSNTLSVYRGPGTNDIWITGQLPQGGQANTFLSIHNPALLGATIFQALLARDGVHFQAPAVTGSLPSGNLQLIASHASRPLSKYLQIQNTYSINLMAENLLRMVGVKNGGNGSARSGVAAVNQFLTRAHVPVNAVQVDGSGLSPLDEASAANVVQLLSYSAGQPWFKTFEHSLIHMGRTNQCSFMCGYMDHTSADGTVWLKTGNLSNQWNYAGYAHAKNGNLIAFAILMDGLRSKTFFQQAIGPQDKMTEAVASWPYESSYGDAAHVNAASPPSFLTKLLPISLAQGDVLGAAAIPVGTTTVAYSYQGGRRLEPGLLPRLAVLDAYLQNPRIAVHSVRVIATGPISAGVVHGSLALSSGGYANLSANELTALAQSVYRRGVRAVTGAIEFVQPPYSGFGGSRLPGSLPWEDSGSAYAAPLSRLMTQGDRVSLTVTGKGPGVTPSVGAPVGPSGLSVENDAVTGAANSASTVRAVWVRGTNTFKLVGSVPAASFATVTVTDPQPGKWTAAAFAEALVQAGVKVPSAAPERLGAQPRGTILASLPLGSVSAASIAARVERALADPSARTPLDLYAELGQKALAEISGVLGAHATIADPSGLGLENYMTADSSARLLANMWGHSVDRPLVASLSRHLWVSKTPEQLTVAGYVRTARGRVYAVTLIVNGLSWSGRFAPSVSWLAAQGASKGT